MARRTKKLRWRVLPVDVSRGQTWATRPARKGARQRFVRIVGVSRGAARIKQPKVTWYEVTRSGKRKAPKSAPLACTFLTVTDGRWTMPSQWELIS